MGGVTHVCIGYFCAEFCVRLKILASFELARPYHLGVVYILDYTLGYIEQPAPGVSNHL